jgi:chemotaxis signal transduction protein
MNDTTAASGQRLILTRVGEVNLMFPAALVAETLLIERTQILALPFYHSAFLGCIAAEGRLVPLVSLSQALSIHAPAIAEILTVIRLGELAEHLAGVGILVDRMVGSQMGLASASSDAPTSDRTKLFDLTLIDRDIFQPQRWQPSEVLDT